MKKLIIFAVFAVACMAFYSCNDTETYSDRVKKENTAIRQFIQDNKIKVIDEETFEANGFKTDTAKNEYVLFEATGVYMQICNQGCGEKLKVGETANILCRFNEYNVMTDSLILTNNNVVFVSIPDKLSATNNGGTIYGTFKDGESVMAGQYGSTTVPSGWLRPLYYINLGRQDSTDEEIARVNIIVPSEQGQYYAQTYTYPTFYELTYQRCR